MVADFPLFTISARICAQRTSSTAELLGACSLDKSLSVTPSGVHMLDVTKPCITSRCLSRQGETATGLSAVDTIFDCHFLCPPGERIRNGQGVNKLGSQARRLAGSHRSARPAPPRQMLVLVHVHHRLSESGPGCAAVRLVLSREAQTVGAIAGGF
jgi:hypothetical protein